MQTTHSKNERAPSFPALSVVNGTHLELKIQSPISQGRTGVTYSASVVQQKQSTPTPVLLPEIFCLKFAKPQYSRSLAREAWFYEQLAQQDSYTGVVTPRCFGLFSVSLEKCATLLGCSFDSLKVEAWSDLRSTHPDERFQPDEEEEQPISDGMWQLDFLPDDHETGDVSEDMLGSKENSRWNTWRGDPAKPLITVLVLEMLGREYYNEHEERDHRGPDNTRSV